MSDIKKEEAEELLAFVGLAALGQPRGLVPAFTLPRSVRESVVERRPTRWAPLPAARESIAVAETYAPGPPIEAPMPGLPAGPYVPEALSGGETGLGPPPGGGPGGPPGLPGGLPGGRLPGLPGGRLPGMPGGRLPGLPGPGGPRIPRIPGRVPRWIGRGRHRPWRWRGHGRFWSPAWYWPREREVVYTPYYLPPAPVADCPEGYYLYIQDDLGRLVVGPLDAKYRADGNLIPLVEPYTYVCLTVVQASARLGLAGADTLGQMVVESPTQMRATQIRARSMSPYVMAGRRAKGIRSFSLRGLGAAGASSLTMQAAQALDEHLTTNTCAGCDNMQSTLRQLTFAFKAACLTDQAVVNQVSLNMSTPLSMTGFGPGTDKALSLVLGAARTYDGGPCTDDQGNCLGNFVTPKIPPQLQGVADSAVKQIRDLIGQAKLAPQEEIIKQLQTIMAKALALIAAAMPAAGRGGLQPAPTAAVEAKKPFPTAQVVIGGLIGVAVVGSITALVLATRKGA